MFGRAQIYPTRKSLDPVRGVIADAAEVFDEKFKQRWRIGVSPKVAGIAGGAVGVGVGKGALLVGAAAGTKGAAALASGLAFSGAVVGGGMAAGIAVVAAPVALIGGGAYLYAKRKTDAKLRIEKQELLAEAEARLVSLERFLSGAEADKELRRHVEGIQVRLAEAIAHLKKDLS